MRFLIPALLLASSVFAPAQPAQIPFDQLPPYWRETAKDIVARADFAFETRTQPKQVRLAAMEKLFDHPRLGAAMWRICQFVPAFYAFDESPVPGERWSIDDRRGLKGTLNLVLRRPGLRVYVVEGVAEKGRLKVPFAIGAKMVTVYRYWEGPKGFESHLQTWTALDNALLGFAAKPFRGYIRGRQDEFIAYINGNIATFGEYAMRHPEEFQGPLRLEGDPVALRDFETQFPRK
jgi:hypothetical protein